MTIGEAIGKCIELAGMSDVQVAAALGTSESTVTRWRSGRRSPSRERYIGLVKLFPELPNMVGAAP
jgi:transcriptional regulator with XRE-family HTH domain